MRDDPLIVSFKTLIVEDEPDLLETCARLLRQAGHSCLTARSGREAITLIDAEHPDLVVTDLRLPTLNGLAVTRHARQVTPPVPVLLITGYSSTEAKREAQAAGAIVFLPKPFTASEFVDAVNRALGTPST
ncbi:MAG: response regulator [Candidatus Rokubacteria bacterium]|nr:response regulator [Candidatus Rokubacteria bacterium]